MRMRVVVILALLTASCSGPSRSGPSHSGPPPRKVLPPVAGAPEPLPFTSECVAPGDASLADLTRRADEATRRGFETELARNHLHVLALAMHQDELGEGLQYMAPQAREGAAVRKKLKDAEGTFVAAESYWTGNPGAPGAWEFVQDDHGDVYRLIRKVRAAITSVRLCTCREQRCGPYGSGCPACGSTNQILYGPLPHGAEYKGELEISYPGNIVSMEHKQDDCPAPPRCPDPPP
jgi:hypothetical protein